MDYKSKWAQHLLNASEHNIYSQSSIKAFCVWIISDQQQNVSPRRKRWTD